MHKFLSIHFEQHIDNAQLLQMNKSHVLQKRIQVFLITTWNFFSNCNKITTCTSTDKWLKQLLVDLSFFSWFRSLYYLCIEKGTLRRGMYRHPPSSRLVNLWFQIAVCQTQRNILFLKGPSSYEYQLNGVNKAGKCTNKRKKLVMKIGFLKPKYCLADRLICIKIPRKVSKNRDRTSFRHFKTIKTVYAFYSVWFSV